MRTVLVFISAFLPGYRAGGALRTLVNIVDWLGDEVRFRVVTLDRDQGEPEQYAGIEPRRWTKVAKSEVYYLPPQDLTLAELRRVIRSTRHDVLYLNSFFNPNFTIKPLLLRRFGRIDKGPLVLAPRGELADGALAQKALKKRTYLFVAKLLGLYKDVIWQASTPAEERCIRRQFGDRATVVVARDLPTKREPPESDATMHCKRPGSLRVMIVSRIDPNKNIAAALDMLARVRGSIDVNLYGVVENEVYWERCRESAARLPDNIRFNHEGTVPHEKLWSLMPQHDLFFLPTRGENYGHAILEAMCAGCPVLISDRTPWRNLRDRGVGWDLPLEREDEFVRVLQECVDMDAATLAQWSARARAYGARSSRDEEALEQNRRLFTGFAR